MGSCLLHTCCSARVAGVFVNFRPHLFAQLFRNEMGGQTNEIVCDGNLLVGGGGGHTCSVGFRFD